MRYHPHIVPPRHAFFNVPQGDIVGSEYKHDLVVKFLLLKIAITVIP